jgi:hypothetical protein
MDARIRRFLGRAKGCYPSPSRGRASTTESSHRLPGSGSRTSKLGTAIERRVDGLNQLEHEDFPIVVHVEGGALCDIDVPECDVDPLHKLIDHNQVIAVTVASTHGTRTTGRAFLRRLTDTGQVPAGHAADRVHRADAALATGGVAPRAGVSTTTVPTWCWRRSRRPCRGGGAETGRPTLLCRLVGTGQIPPTLTTGRILRAYTRLTFGNVASRAGVRTATLPARGRSDRGCQCWHRGTGTIGGALVCRHRNTKNIPFSRAAERIDLNTNTLLTKGIATAGSAARDTADTLRGYRGLLAPDRSCSHLRDDRAEQGGSEKTT